MSEECLEQNTDWESRIEGGFCASGQIWLREWKRQSHFANNDSYKNKKMVRMARGE